MPTRLRSLMLACAFAALAVFSSLALSGVTAGTAGLESAAAAVNRPTPPRFAPKPPARKPTLGKRAATIALKAVGVPYRW